MRILFVFLLSVVFSYPVFSQHRGLWVVRHTLLNDTQSGQILPLAEQLNITDLYIQVRALGRTFFQRDSVFTPDDGGTAFNNFKYILQNAHRQNIKIHAWINAFYINLSSAEGHQISLGSAEQKNYILRRANDMAPPDRKALKKGGIEGEFIDPLYQKNLTYIKSLSAYLIDSLGVDGIHLDYFRYPAFNFSFSPAGRTDFILKHYMDPADIYSKNGTMSLQQKYQLDLKYKNYLQNNIKNALRQIQTSIWRKNKKIVLSVAVKANARTAKENYLQNWQDWLRENDCDRIILMNYNNQDSVFYNNIGLIDKDLDKKRIVIGIATYNAEMNTVLQRIKQIESSAFAGYNLFSYNDINKKPTLLLRLKKRQAFLFKAEKTLTRKRE